jgi:hypothetical protein
MSRLVLDAGALIAIDRGNRDMLSLMWRARRNGQPVRTNPMALAQAWKLCGAAGINAVVIGC